MAQTDNSALETHSAPLAARLAWIALILATLYVSYFHNLGAIGFVGPDEPRYAWIARDMAETGDWVTPRLYGKPWFEKPVLYYWGAAFSFKLFGVSEAAARFPSALAALFATLAMAWLAWHMYGAETARWLLLLLPTTVGMIGFSHAAATDMPFAGMLTIAMVCAAVILGIAPPFGFSLHTPASSRYTESATRASTYFSLLLFGFFLGLAVLAKGPAAIILSGGAVLLWAIFTRRWRDAFRCLHPIAIASFCLTALPWYVLCARRNPDFFRVFIIEHNFKRYLTPEFQHLQPFWYYVPILLACFIPWLFVFAWTLYAGFQNLRSSLPKTSPALFLISWSAFCFVFFSISKSKLPGYILPAVPAIGLLVAHQFTRFPKHPRRFGAFIGIFAVLLFVGVELSNRMTLGKNASNLMATHLLLGVLLVMAISNWFLALAYFPWGNSVIIPHFLRLLAVAPVLLALIGWPHYLTRLERGMISPKVLAEGLLEHRIPLDRVFVRKNANRSWRFGTSFYLHSEVKDWNPENLQEAFVITGAVACSELRIPGYECNWIPFREEAGWWFLCHVVPHNSGGGLSGPGAPGGSDGGAGRQAR